MIVSRSSRLGPYGTLDTLPSRSIQKSNLTWYKDIPYTTSFPGLDRGVTSEHNILARTETNHHFMHMVLESMKNLRSNRAKIHNV